MNRQEHITSLRLEIDNNIDELIKHCISGKLDEARLTAACVRGSRHKLAQLIKWDMGQTQISRTVVIKRHALSIASSGLVYLIIAALVSVMGAMAFWFYSFRYSM